MLSKPVQWRELIAQLYEDERAGTARPKFYPPASAEQIRELENALRQQLPRDLRGLLLQTDGVVEEFLLDGEWIESMWLIWSVTEILQANASYRSRQSGAFLDRNFHKLLFFTGAGVDGILFAHPVDTSAVAADQVLAWHPIEDNLTGTAPSIEGFVRGWLSGQISV